MNSVNSAKANLTFGYILTITTISGSVFTDALSIGDKSKIVVKQSSADIEECLAEAEEKRIKRRKKRLANWRK